MPTTAARLEDGLVTSLEAKVIKTDAILRKVPELILVPDGIIFAFVVGCSLTLLLMKILTSLILMMLWSIPFARDILIRFVFYYNIFISLIILVFLLFVKIWSCKKELPAFGGRETARGRGREVKERKGFRSGQLNLSLYILTLFL